MSLGVLRGERSAAQAFAAAALRAAARARGPHAAAAPVSLAQLLHHCMTTDPHHVFMTNGATGVKTTNKQFLELSVPLARALRAKGLAGKTVVVAARGHERTVAVYLALCFAGVVPLLTDPASTASELQYYINLAEPSVIFCDAATHETVKAVTPAPGAPVVVAIHTGQLLDFAKGYGGDIDEFRVPDAEPEATVLLLPTSGSTGMPKAAHMNNTGLIQQLPTIWMHHTKFPTPTQRVMVLTTPQWITFTLCVTTCCVFRVELLMSPDLPSVDHVLHMMERYRPTWTYFGPAFAKELAAAATPQHLSSLETVLTLGSRATPDIHDALQEKMRVGGRVCDGYGLTEAQGFVALTDPGAPRGCTGSVANILHYKLVKDDGSEADVGEEGELYLKGDCIIKGYLKQESAEAARADGWLRTGDAFTADRQGRLYYQRRLKFTFKHNNQLVSPEEVEGLVASLPFVAECVVCAAAAGPAAGVVVRAACGLDDAQVRQAIHQLVASTLSEHKQLRGGIAIVASLPHTHSGKLQRAKCSDLIARLARAGLCR